MSNTPDTLTISYEGRWLTTKEAVAYTGVHYNTIVRAVKSGKLKAVRVNGSRHRRHRKEWLDEWLEGEAQSTDRNGTEG